jgi:hypothetical protein
MDPLTFDLILAGASMGLQALNTLAAKRSEMTPEQEAQSDAVIAKFQGRITAAQQMVTPYLKETIKDSVPTVEIPAPKEEPNAGSGLETGRGET